MGGIVIVVVIFVYEMDFDGMWVEFGGWVEVIV